MDKTALTNGINQLGLQTERRRRITPNASFHSVLRCCAPPEIARMRIEMVNH